MVVGAEDPGWEGRGFLYHGFRVYDVCGARAGNVCATESRDRRAAIGWWDDMLHKQGATNVRTSNSICTVNSYASRTHPAIRPPIAQKIRPELQNAWNFQLDPEYLGPVGENRRYWSSPDFAVVSPLFLLVMASGS
jgi:hypothetical protein